eukprot:Clim_evm37s240 gene=Clim_evmTU37s240
MIETTATNAVQGSVKAMADRKTEEEWYHIGTARLRELREQLIRKSVTDRSQHVRDQQARIGISTEPNASLDDAKAIKLLEIKASQIIQGRPFTTACLGSGGDLSEVLFVGTRAGKIHAHRASECVGFANSTDAHDSVPVHGLSVMSSVGNSSGKLVSTGADGYARIWAIKASADGKTHCLERVWQSIDHGTRVNRCSVNHSLPSLLATACHDHSWRLFDVERSEEVLHQEGHSAPVYNVTFAQSHPALLASAGFDGFPRLWDLRSGHCVWVLGQRTTNTVDPHAHTDMVLGLSISPGLTFVATGGADNTAKLWDVRQQRHFQTIALHTGMVTDCRFADLAGTGESHVPQRGRFLVTSSHDGSTAIVSVPEVKPIAHLRSPNDRPVLFAGDLSRPAETQSSSPYPRLVTVDQDSTYRLWEGKMSSYKSE